MNQFNNRTPQQMLFHKIYWLIWTPAQITMGAMASWELKDAISTFTTWEMADFIYGIVTVLLMATYFTGFFKNKRYAWQALMTQLVLNMVYAVVALYIFSRSGDSTYGMSLIIGTSIRCIPVGIYYSNRKHLFTKEGTPMPQGSIFFGGGQPPRGNGWNGQNNQWNQNNNQWNNQQWQNSQNTQFTQPQNAENPQPQQTAPDTNGQNTTTAVCPFCGKKVKPTSNFCIYCGKKLK